MKKQYIEPSVRIHQLMFESSILKLSDPPASGVKNFMLEEEVDNETTPGVMGGDYGDNKPGFIEGD